MVALSTLGSFAGLVPPITLGYLINDLVERKGVKPEDALWAALLAGAIVLEAAAYIASDGLYARNAGRLYRSLRLRMFDSVTATPAAERLLRAEVRLGWVQAVNLHASGALAKLGPIAVVVVAASAGGYRAGTLLTLYLLAARAFYGFDGLVDLSLGMQSVRGAIARCLEIVDRPAVPRVPAAA